MVKLSPLRLLGAMASGPIVVLAFSLRGKYLFDDFTPIVSALGCVWVAGSGWVLSGIAKSAGGWGQVEIGDAILISLFVLTTHVGFAFFLTIVGLGRMH